MPDRLGERARRDSAQPEGGERADDRREDDEYTEVLAPAVEGVPRCGCGGGHDDSHVTPGRGGAIAEQPLAASDSLQRRRLDFRRKYETLVYRRRQKPAGRGKRDEQRVGAPPERSAPIHEQRHIRPRNGRTRAVARLGGAQRFAHKQFA